MLQWLKNQLSKDVKIEEIDCEDWGWYTYIYCNNEKYMLGARQIKEMENEKIKWSFFMVREEKNIFQKIIGKTNNSNSCLVNVKDIFIQEESFERIQIVYEGRF